LKGVPLGVFINLLLYCFLESLHERNAFGCCRGKFRLQQGQLQSIEFRKFLICFHINDWLADDDICFLEKFDAVIKLIRPGRARSGLRLDSQDFFLKFGEFLFVSRRQLKLVTTDAVNLSGLGGNDALADC